jgi:hypothetical protein
MSEMITAEDHGDVAVLRLAHGIVAAKIRHSRPMLVRERPVVVAVCGSSGAGKSSATNTPKPNMTPSQRIMRRWRGGSSIPRRGRTLRRVVRRPGVCG